MPTGTSAGSPCGMGGPARAARHLQHAATLAPDDANAHEWLGTALRDEGRMTEAVQSLRRAVALAPEHACAGLIALLFALHLDPDLLP